MRATTWFRSGSKPQPKNLATSANEFAATQYAKSACADSPLVIGLFSLRRQALRLSLPRFQPPGGSILSLKSPVALRYPGRLRPQSVSTQNCMMLRKYSFTDGAFTPAPSKWARTADVSKDARYEK